MEKLTINDKEYNMADMTEEQNAIISEIKYAQSELSSAKYAAALLEARVDFLVAHLSNSLESVDDTSEVQEE